MSPSTVTTSRSLDDLEDPDNEAVKYNKRLRKKRPRLHHHAAGGWKQYSIMAAVLVLAFWFIATVLFFVWNYSSNQSVERIRMEREERQAKAEKVWRERHYDERGYRPERKLELSFQEERNHLTEKGEMKLVRSILHEWLEDLNQDVIHNVNNPKPRWIRPYLLPPLPDADEEHGGLKKKKEPRKKKRDGPNSGFAEYFKVDRIHTHMQWKKEWDSMSKEEQNRGPKVDYTDPDKYKYPKVQRLPPAEGGYPVLRTLQEMMHDWHQDEDNHGVITEALIHFNYSDPTERAAAARFRDAALPFKLYDVPEITRAGEKWTDHYLIQNFRRSDKHGKTHRQTASGPTAQGNAQESPSNFFAFFIPKLWDVDSMGLPPTRNNDWSFSDWATHARYADAVGLSAGQPHFYWQSGVPPEERHHSSKSWTFITRDLREMSATNTTFLVFHPDQQKGIQCRFGERGVVAATHYDGGRNMVAMITGAKRYILSPPNQCSKLGIFLQKRSPIYRHSLLNFGHLKHLESTDEATQDMSPEERAWLERAATSRAVETVLKQGEILYIPSHWFHYIVSVQKSAQCNVRSGIDHVGSREFGGQRDVETCQDS